MCLSLVHSCLCSVKTGVANQTLCIFSLCADHTHPNKRFLEVLDCTARYRAQRKVHGTDLSFNFSLCTQMPAVSQGQCWYVTQTESGKSIKCFALRVRACVRGLEGVW